MYCLPALITLALVGCADQRGTRPQEGTLQVGSPAADFSLKVVGQDKTFKLSNNFGKRPTMLIFGSYT